MLLRYKILRKLFVFQAVEEISGFDICKTTLRFFLSESYFKYSYLQVARSFSMVLDTKKEVFQKRNRKGFYSLAHSLGTKEC